MTNERIKEAAKILQKEMPNPVFDILKPHLMGEFKAYVANNQYEYVSWTTIKDILKEAMEILANETISK